MQVLLSILITACILLVASFLPIVPALVRPVLPPIPAPSDQDHAAPERIEVVALRDLVSGKTGVGYRLPLYAWGIVVAILVGAGYAARSLSRRILRATVHRGGR